MDKFNTLQQVWEHSQNEKWVLVNGKAGTIFGIYTTGQIVVLFPDGNEESWLYKYLTPLYGEELEKYKTQNKSAKQFFEELRDRTSDFMTDTTATFVEPDEAIEQVIVKNFWKLL